MGATNFGLAENGFSVDTSGDFNLEDLLTDASWQYLLRNEPDKEYFKQLEQKLAAEYRENKTIYPPREQIFYAFHLTPVDKVKVVILGQDPYPNEGQATGLAFSVPPSLEEKKVPRSLKNMYKELDRDREVPGFRIPDHGCLEDWAKQGVLLLNATLTIEAGKQNSHAKFGWQTFTDNVIKAISDRRDSVVFLLFGNFAHKKEELIDGRKHVIIKTAHPSPLSFSKFFGSCCFSECNMALMNFGLSPINWSL